MCRPWFCTHATTHRFRSSRGGNSTALIPGSRFVRLEGSNHLILAFEPGWKTAIGEVRAFLGVEGSGAGELTPGTVQTGALSMPAGLTAREGEVLRLIAFGQRNRDIAGELFITTNTVANHVKNILSKTGTANRTEAAAFAVANRLT